MSLREDQVVRYSRQILLTKMGGRGQERLLGVGARVCGEGQAIAVASAYLAAGGTPVQALAAQTLRGEQQGFLQGTDWAQAVALLNSDAAGEATSWGQISELPIFRGFTEDGPWVALAGAGSDAICVHRPAEGCRACFALQLEGVGSLGLVQGPLQVFLGTWAALVFQRSVLGWVKESVRSWRMSPSGRAEAFEASAVRQCIACQVTR